MSAKLPVDFDGADRSIVALDRVKVEISLDLEISVADVRLNVADEGAPAKSPSALCAAAAVAVWRFTGEDSISLSIDGKVIPFEFSADGTTVTHLLKLVSDAEAGTDGDATAVVHCAGKDGVSAGHGEMVFCCTPSTGAAWEIWVEYDEGSFAAACGHVD